MTATELAASFFPGVVINHRAYVRGGLCVGHITGFRVVNRKLVQVTLTNDAGVAIDYPSDDVVIF